MTNLQHAINESGKASAASARLAMKSGVNHAESFLHNLVRKQCGLFKPPNVPCRIKSREDAIRVRVSLNDYALHQIVCLLTIV